MARKSTLRKKMDASDRKRAFQALDIVILAGGLGTRLRPAVSDRPKVLAEIGGRPFMDVLIENLLRAGMQRIILSVGYLKDHIKDYYAEQGILFAEEESPLGTGGGVKNAERFVQSDQCFVMNGDSWITGGIDFKTFHDFHRSKNALATLMLTRPRKEKDYGAVFLEEDGKISGFNEKAKENKTHFMNAGVYLIEKKAFRLMPCGAFSLEIDFFPRLVGGAFYGFPVDGDLIDIGTPERYRAANDILHTS